MLILNKKKHTNFLKAIENPKKLINDFSYLKKKRRFFLFFKILKFFSISILIFFLFLLILLFINFVNLKLIYQSAMAGKENAEIAVALLKENKFILAGEKAQIAENNFNNSLVKISIYQKNYFIANLGILKSQVNNIVYLLSSAEILSRSINNISNFGSSLEWFFNKEDLNFNKLNKTEKRKILAKIYEAGPELNGIKANINLALMDIKNVRLNGLLWPFKNKIINLENQIAKMDDIFNKAVPISQILPPLLGYPNNSAFLVALQNSDELRPTGGFIGTYGILEMDSGDINRFDTHDIYHMDMPVKDKINIIPPEPIKKYLVPKWYMRDSNWSPDWPTSAEKLLYFYKIENDLLPPKDQINNFSGIFDGVIGITPKLVTDLLEFTGPIKISGVEYHSDNFTDLLQYQVEKGFEKLGVSSWQRKEVIGEILKEMKIRLLSVSSKQLVDILNIVEENLSQKNIILYFKDKQLEEYADDQGWTATVKTVDSDYLMIVDANMGSFKTDAVISRSFDYKIKQDSKSLTADLKINYMHKGSFDWKTTRYRTYTRIYVPLGSKLVKAEGYSEGEVDIYNELNKTVFGLFLSVEPGQIGNLHFSYILPDNINELGGNKEYKLIINKQPGVNSVFSSVDLEFINSVKSYSPTGFYANKYDDGIKWEGELKNNMEYKVIF